MQFLEGIYTKKYLPKIQILLGILCLSGKSTPSAWSGIDILHNSCEAVPMVTIRMLGGGSHGSVKDLQESRAWALSSPSDRPIPYNNEMMITIDLVPV